MKEENNIPNHRKECLPPEVLLKYVQGKLSGIEKNLVERHLSSCEMCSDELEGLSSMEHPEMIDDISLELNEQVDALTAKPEKEIPYLGLYIRIAASIVLFLGISTVIYFTAFRKTPALLPNYALMEVEVPPPAPPYDSSNDKMLKRIEEEKRIENQEFDANRKSKKREVEGKRNAKSDEAIKYVAPVVVDSISERVADEAIVEKVVVMGADSGAGNKIEVAEVSQVPAGNFAQPIPVSSDKKSLFASGALAKTKSVSGVAASKELNSSEIYNTKKETSINLVSNGRYEDALAILNGLYNDFPKNDTIQFYASMCYYRLNRLDYASKALKKFIVQHQSAFYHEGKWYYALCLIKTDRLNEADSVLQSIVDEGSPFSNDAEQRLDDLRDSIK